MRLTVVDDGESFGHLPGWRHSVSPSALHHRTPRRQLERLQASLAGSASQLQAVQADLRARDGEAAALRGEVAALQRRLQALQEAQAKAATRDLVQAVVSDPALPPGVAQALALDYARSHLRSELTWTRAKLAFVAQMAAQLRRKLAAADAAREQAGELSRGAAGPPCAGEASCRAQPPANRQAGASVSSHLSCSPLF